MHKILFGVTYKDDLEQLGRGTIWRQLEVVQRQRNAFMHGNPESIGDSIVDGTVALIPTFHEAWIESFNMRCARQDRLLQTQAGSHFPAGTSRSRVARAKGRRIGRPSRTLLSAETRTAIAESYASEGTSLRLLAKKFGILWQRFKDALGRIKRQPTEQRYLTDSSTLLRTKNSRIKRFGFGTPLGSATSR